MSNARKTIAKNAGVMMASQLITWGLALLLAIFLPRYLGPTAIGELSIAFAIWSLATVILSFGTDTYLTKEIAINHDKVGVLTINSIVMRCLLFIPCSLFVLLFLLVMRYSTTIIYMAVVFGIYIFFMQLSGALAAALTGLERMEFVSVANIVSKAIMTGLSLLLLFLGFNIYWIGMAYILSAVVAALITGYSLARQTKLRLNLNLGEIRTMMRGGSPYLVTSMTLIAYQQVDKLFISGLVTTEAVGWYGTAMSLFGTLMFVPVVIGTVLFPMLSRAYNSGANHLAVVARHSFDLVFMLSIPIGLGLVIIGEPLVLFIFGPEFAPAGDILAVLGIVLILTYLNTILGQLIIAANRTGKWNMIMITAVLLTLPLDLLLVPLAERMFANGALGGALSFAITELIMVVGAILLLPKGTMSWRSVRTVVLVGLAGLGMVVVCWGFRYNNLLLVIPLGAITYSGLVLMLRVLSPEELALLRDGVARVIDKLRGNKQAPAQSGD